ncbi:hypothetical protein MRB53_037957 [Persea americana]|nr:hypothetical protein MRB53_037957 [Persea americana]
MRIWCCSVLVLSLVLADEFTQTVTNNGIISSQKITTTSQQTTSKINTSKSKTASPTDTLTCGARSVNYITDILPQQCLRTDWTRSRTSHTQTKSDALAQQSTETESRRDGTHTDATITSVLTTSYAQDPDLATNATSDLPQDETSASVAIATTKPSENASTIEPTAETDSDPLLDESSFLSFEDWKQQNLAKAGQSGENIGSKHVETGRRAPDLNDFETLGDENEIDIDFSGFGGAAQRPHKPAIDTIRSATSSGESTASQDSHASQALRPRDAGKTCKERTNYASFDCAATILKSNPECKSASSILIENKDSYMLNKCSAKDKHFIVELCNDILVDTIVLANYEFFSSIFRHFKVSISDRYPAKSEGWKDLGTFEARNTREVQAFLIENPLIWARYLRIEFRTHYGSEYYCPISLLRVHGTTMMEEFRNQEESARGDLPQHTAEAVSEVLPAPTTVTEPMHTTVAEKKGIVGGFKSDSVSTTSISEEVSATPTTDVSSSLQARSDETMRNIVTISPQKNPFESRSDTCAIPSTSTSAYKRSSSSISLTSVTQTASMSIEIVTKNSTASSTSTAASNTTTSAVKTSSKISSGSTTSSSNNTVSSKTVNDTAVKSSLNNSVIANSTSNETTTLSSPHTNTTKPQSHSSTAAQAQPSTQESFFKSISKRLQQLESNSSLSMQYIEQSSRILREAFNKVEKRQIGSTTAFLSNLNNTVMAELAGFRQAYDQLWQSTVIELEGQREQHRREMTDLSSRLTLVVDELVWQKRMGIVQSTLLLLCLALVLFARNGNSSIEIPFMHHVMSRSQTAFRSNPGSDQNSPASGRSPVSLFRRKIWKSDGDSASSRPGTSEGIMPSGLATPHSLDEQDVPAITYSEHDDSSGSELEADYAD